MHGDDERGESVGADFLPPPPTGGETANLALSRGTVLVRLPSSQQFTLAGAAQVPIGTQVDATSGVEGDRRAASRSTRASSTPVSSPFSSRASGRSASPPNGGDFADCVPSIRALAKKRPTRRLWGSGKGRYRTRGRYSSATVRGTKWLTEDLCDGTRTTVVEGTVVVHDFVRDLDDGPAGHTYRADALPRGVRNAGCTVVGTSKRDFLRGTPGRDVICGLGGDDV